MIWMLLVVSALADGPTFRFDFSDNVISGDVSGQTLGTIAQHADELDACLEGAEALFDARGGVPTLDIRVAADGALERFAFLGDDMGEINACVQAEMEGVELPAGKYGAQFGMIKLRRAEAPQPTSGSVHRHEADGLALELRASPRRVGAKWGVDVVVEATPTAGSRGIGEQSLSLVPDIYRSDGTSNHVASWSIGDQNPAPCVSEGATTRRTASHGGRDLLAPGDVLRATIVLTHGTCDDAMKQRTVVGALEMKVPAEGEPEVTLWSASALDARPDP